MLFPTTRDAASRGLSEEIWQFFRQQGEQKYLSPQEGLIRQDEPIDPIFLIESGLVRLTRTNAQGREVVVALRFPGTMLGAASAVSGSPAAASAATLEASRIHCLPANAFLQQMETSPAFARQVTRAICQNYYEQTLHLARLGSLSALGRVASLLLQFTPAAEPNRSGEIRLQLPKLDPAEGVGNQSRKCGASETSANRPL